MRDRVDRTALDTQKTIDELKELSNPARIPYSWCTGNKRRQAGLRRLEKKGLIRQVHTGAWMQIEIIEEELMSKLEAKFLALWVNYFPKVKLEREYRFHDTRKFRFDFAHPESKVAIEINGGTWGKSGHSSGYGIQRDYEKSNLALTEGWKLFQLSSNMITYDWLHAIHEAIANAQSND